MPAGARPPSGAWSPAACSGSHGVQRAAARARAHLRLEVPAALPAQPHQVEAARRVQHLRGAPAARGVRAVVVERELEQRGARGERGAGAQRAAGEGGGAEAEGLSAIEAAADHGESEHGIARKGPFVARTNAILHRWTNVSRRGAQSGQAPRSTTSWASIA